MGYRRLALDGGAIEYVVSTPRGATDLLLFHVGTPSAAVVYPGLTRAAGAAGMQVATYSRAGYGRSARRAGRTVADEAWIAAAIADRLGHARFFTMGWSGGGPVALACAALIPDRVRACMAIAALSPPFEAGAVWSTFWRPEQYGEWKDLIAGDVEALRPDFEETVPYYGRMTVARLRARVNLDPRDSRGDRNDLRAEVQPPLVKSMRRAMSRGYLGYLDDNLAQAREWGFRVADIRVPVVIRHGELDILVPVAHGRWLASAIPGARGVFLGDAGHGSVVLPWEETVAQLVEAAR